MIVRLRRFCGITDPSSFVFIFLQMHLIFASADAQSAAKNAGGCPWPAKKTDFQGRFTEY
ncbi:MAG: hypothetical protein HFI69_10315 [Lachnospiraceae bacterium]|nr:hypothetical protein [Lachnospiraceae bacterium]